MRPHTRIGLVLMIKCLAMMMMIVSAAESPPFSCDPSSPTPPYPFCNISLPISNRAHDVVSRLTLDEKVLQLVNGAPEIPRLGISAYEWWSEALHGVSRHGKGVRFNGTITTSTMFPQVILTAASFDSSLWYRIGQAIGREARAMYNEGQAKGLTFWAPNINVLRDPRWGRGQETPGEDPLVVGDYSVSYVRGIQGDSFEGGKIDPNSDHLQASACCKHFVANDLDNWNTANRYNFDANITQQDLADTYLVPFQRCVQEGKASGIMCAYNRVNGLPNCADYNLLTKTAREAWGFKGYIASDCDPVAIMHDVQGYSKLPEDAVASVLKAGMDVNCGSYLKKYTKSAVEQNKVTEAEIDRALENLFTIRMRLGLFNGNPKTGIYGNLGPDQVCSKEHQDLALEAARNGIVLLKNSANLLPLSKTETTSIAVIGPNANVTQTLLGNYEGEACKNITVLQALQNYVKNTQYHQGCVDLVNCTSIAINDAVRIAKAVDHVILVMGLDQSQEREKLDRLQLVLPGKQEALVSAVARAAKKPVSLVLLCGGPVDVSFAKDDAKIGSILWAGYPGEAGGVALAEIIFGDHNPGGRLPMTWYPKEFANVPMTDMRMRPDPSSGYPGRTYRFYNGKTVFKFGYGLSYSTHSYKFVSHIPNKIHLGSNQVSPSRNVLLSWMGMDLCEKAKFTVVVDVENHGQAGNHTVLLFAKWDDKESSGHFIKQLAGFRRVSLGDKERGEVDFVVKPCEHFGRANKDGLMVLEEGSRSLIVGDKEHNIEIVLYDE
ncbi:probable beta-D-xylosidase 7 [Cynara cardunculus var. scolymus]|uniref:probable beta-D-xylosidase 7 n=1 Tax=Cynara cardunculus var. scolymus TaxID=59895 RepID=UPI000D6233EE|nr:probable beta-D-xylosidase 7 [Cynara cardunculus var. scolymus]